MKRSCANWRRWAMSVMALVSVAAAADDPECEYPKVPTVPFGESCDRAWHVGGPSEAPVWTPPPAPTGLQARSLCWLGVTEMLKQTCTLQPPPSLSLDPLGFYLKINPVAQPSIGNFLPPSPTLGGSSVCLLPAGAEGAATGWQGLSRPTLDGVVDLVTGLPLARSQLSPKGTVGTLGYSHSGSSAAAATLTNAITDIAHRRQFAHDRFIPRPPDSARVLHRRFTRSPTHSSTPDRQTFPSRCPPTPPLADPSNTSPRRTNRGPRAVLNPRRYTESTARPWRPRAKYSEYFFNPPSALHLQHDQNFHREFDP